VADDLWAIRTKLIVQIGVSLIVLISSLVIIFGQYPDDYKKWAFGTVGLVVGYWLR
jgi:hypothetical protein